MGWVRIVMTDHAPIEVEDEAWPVIVTSTWDDSMSIIARIGLPTRRCTIALSVRLHADGRCIVYGSRADEGTPMGHGTMCRSTSEAPAALHFVATKLGVPGLPIADEAIAQLPPVRVE